MEESIVERVLILIKDYGLTASEFADKIDVQRSSMSHLVSGRNKPSLDFIQKILNNFSDINPTWLIMGSGPMKQLDLFDIKGDVAPAEPLPVKQAKTEEITSSEGEQKSIRQVYQTETDALAVPNKNIQEPATVIQAQVPVQEVILPVSQQVSEPPLPSSTQQPATQPTVVATIPQIVASVAPETPAKDSFMHATTEKSVQNDKKVTKIVFFYSDNTFETFNPQ